MRRRDSTEAEQKMIWNILILARAGSGAYEAHKYLQKVSVSTHRGVCDNSAAVLLIFKGFYFLARKAAKEPVRIEQSIDWKSVVSRYYINKGELDSPHIIEADGDNSNNKDGNDNL